MEALDYFSAPEVFKYISLAWRQGPRKRAGGELDGHFCIS